jgi:uncharacterized DUF497 family protein
VYEWHTAQASANLRKHGVSFEDAATVFLDPLALTFPDPVHSGEEARDITVGNTAGDRVVFVSHCQRGNRVRIIGAREATRRERRQYKKASVSRLDDTLRPEYDLSQLKGGVRGKYYRQAVAGTNLMLIEPELAEVFRDADAVNRALRLLADTAKAVTGTARRRHISPNNPAHSTRKKQVRGCRGSNLRRLLLQCRSKLDRLRPRWRPRFRFSRWLLASRGWRLGSCLPIWWTNAAAKVTPATPLLLW